MGATLTPSPCIDGLLRAPVGDRAVQSIELRLYPADPVFVLIRRQAGSAVDESAAHPQAQPIRACLRPLNQNSWPARPSAKVSFRMLNSSTAFSRSFNMRWTLFHALSIVKG